MTIQELKNKIENTEPVTEFIIFVSENTFIPHQYVSKIAEYTGSTIVYLDTFESIINGSNSLFSSPTEEIRVYVTEEFDTHLTNLPKNSFVFCEKVSKSVKDNYANNIITVPKLKDWQLNEYAALRAPGITKDDLSWLVGGCKNVFKLEQELSKLSIFSEVEQPNVFLNFKQDGIFSDLCNSTMFDLSNAVIQNDKNMACMLLEKLELFDFNIFALLSLLCSNLTNIFSVQTFPATTASSLGISDKQLYVIKKYQTKHYTSSTLLKMLEICLDIENKIKMGELPADNAMDYLIVKLYMC